MRPIGTVRGKFFALVATLIFSSWFSAPCQIDRAGLSGTVTDSSGRVLPHTHVVAVHNATGLRRETISSSTGTYDIPELPVGDYTITFDHIGFKELTFVDVQQVIGPDPHPRCDLAGVGRRGDRENLVQLGADGP